MRFSSGFQEREENKKCVKENTKMLKVDNQIVELQQDIMWGEHNACEGYQLTKMLKELLLRKEELKILKNNYNQLNILFGNHRKTILELKERVINDTNNKNKLFFKKFAIGKCKGKKSNIVSINRSLQTAK